MSWTCPHPVRVLPAIKGSPQKNMLNDVVCVCCGMRLRMAGKVGLRSFYGHFVRWKFDNGSGTEERRWAFIEILQSHLPCQVICSPDMVDSLQMQSNSSAHFFLSDKCTKSTGKIWKFTQCSQYKKFGFFFRWHPLQAHRFICIMGWYVGGSVCVCMH